MKVVIAPDGFGGTLTALEAADAIADGWLGERPDDDVVLVPMSDGGEGLLDVVARPDDTWIVTEVAGPLGHPVDAALLLRSDGSALIESARACGLALVPSERRTPRLATSYGVGELLDAARDVGATRISVGLGGSASVDGGAGALTGLGLRVTVADGSGLKIGDDDLHRVAAASWGWAEDWSGIEVVLLADVPHVLADAARVFGPQKGATPDEVEGLTAALGTWADVAERDLARGQRHRDEPGSGAAGGLGFGLRCALPTTSVARGVDVVADLVGLDDALAGADLVITGEGRLDQTSWTTKVVAAVHERARAAGVATVAAVVGSVSTGTDTERLDVVESASESGPGPDPSGDVEAAAARLARRH
ncbi:MAG: glycerate kinase [Nitriliruptor sp.]|uniref:glycerate kinase n=1 Tax=Nitriliruptor sp. TaxID=2448056 RepID=UPI0034A0A30B